MNAPEVDMTDRHLPTVSHNDRASDPFEASRASVDPDHDPAYVAVRAAFEREFREEESAATWREWVTIDPNVMVGKPTFKDTRLTVELVLEQLGAGASEQDLLDSYPRLRTEHIRAACAFAADALRRRTKDIFADDK